MIGTQSNISRLTATRLTGILLYPCSTSQNRPLESPIIVSSINLYSSIPKHTKRATSPKNSLKSNCSRLHHIRARQNGATQASTRAHNRPERWGLYGYTTSGPDPIQGNQDGHGGRGAARGGQDVEPVRISAATAKSFLRFMAVLEKIKKCLSAPLCNRFKKNFLQIGIYNRLSVRFGSNCPVLRLYGIIKTTIGSFWFFLQLYLHEIQLFHITTLAIISSKVERIDPANTKRSRCFHFTRSALFCAGSTTSGADWYMLNY